MNNILLDEYEIVKNNVPKSYKPPGSNESTYTSKPSWFTSKFVKPVEINTRKTSKKGKSIKGIKNLKNEIRDIQSTVPNVPIKVVQKVSLSSGLNINLRNVAANVSGLVHNQLLHLINAIYTKKQSEINRAYKLYMVEENKEYRINKINELLTPAMKRLLAKAQRVRTFEELIGLERITIEDNSYLNKLLAQGKKTKGKKTKRKKTKAKKENKTKNSTKSKRKKNNKSKKHGGSRKKIDATN